MKIRLKPGVTLIETVVAMVLMGIIALVFFAYISEGFSAWFFVSGQKGLIFSGRAAINRMVRELKRIDKNDHISVFTTSEVDFIDVDNNSIVYSQEATRVRRNADVLVDNLLNPGGLVFKYLDSSGIETGTKSNIRAIRVRLTLVKGVNRYVVESAARLRIF